MALRKCVQVNYSDVKSDIQQQLRRMALVPVLGAGFTKDCISRKGKVPSGDSYKAHMIDQIMNARSLSNDARKKYEQYSFQTIATLYHRIITKEEQRKYLNDNFTGVELPENKKRFLDISWPYIYTLNIDDAIENNSPYNTVIISNRESADEIFSERKCVVKIHGDVNDILSYEDSDCLVFDTRQYINSLHTNKALLNRLKHDYEYLNLIYIGSSLSDEIDILSIVSEDYSIGNNNHYYCTTEEVGDDELIILSDYGITHCVKFNSYDDIYMEIVNAALSAEKIEKSEVEKFKTYKFVSLKDGFDENRAYLFHGKRLIDRKLGEVSIPSFFISREVTDRVLMRISREGTQILVGSGCSGKTYVTIDIARRVSDRDVFILQSVEELNEESFSYLLGRESCVIVADSKALQKEQIERIIKSSEQRISKRNSFVIMASKNDHDLLSLLSRLRLLGAIRERELIPDELNSKLNEKENKEINEKLLRSSFGIFLKDKSVADNIIEICRALQASNRFERISLKTESIKDVACLISLATMEKIYSDEVVVLNIEKEFVEQKKKAAPLIDDEATWGFERSAAQNSPMKYVVNAEFWLYRQLDNMAGTKIGRDKIVRAYEYIIQKIIERYGKPSLKFKTKNAKYKSYILFDNINQIFAHNGRTLIEDIYKNLNPYLSEDPDYLHQRAKCYIRSASWEKQPNKIKKLLDNARRDAIAANRIFEQRYNESGNEKVQISFDHTLYTAAIALCHLAKQECYENISYNEMAVEFLRRALCSLNNSVEFIKRDKICNYGNIIDETINTLIMKFSTQTPKVQEEVNNLINIKRERGF